VQARKYKRTKQKTNTKVNWQFGIAFEIQRRFQIAFEFPTFSVYRNFFENIKV